MDDDLQILTLPYNNDLYAIHRKTNNIKVIILLVLHAILVVSFKHEIVIFIIDYL